MPYGCEAWTCRKADENKIEAAEMWFYRRLLRVKWTDKRTNKSILEELGVSKQLLREINKRKLKYLGHATRNKQATLMTTVLQGKMEAKRNPGRPPTSYMRNITNVSGMKLHEVAQKSQDRREWRHIVLASTAAANIGGDDADR